MKYEIFFKRFGGSARTKNLQNDSNGAANKRHFILPKNSELPRDFIRQCPWEMEYVFTIATRAKVGILEIGRFNGGSTFIFACAAPATPVYSIDIAPQDDDRLLGFLKDKDVGSNVTLIVGDSTKMRDDVGELDLLFIDGAHDYEGCYADIATWYPKLQDGGHILFHDSYLGEHGVQDAIVDFLGRHPQLDIIVSPFIGPTYWHYTAGSICHLWKRPR